VAFIEMTEEGIFIVFLLSFFGALDGNAANSQNSIWLEESFYVDL
jgi:hypothetical protein